MCAPAERRLGLNSDEERRGGGRLRVEAGRRRMTRKGKGGKWWGGGDGRYLISGSRGEARRGGLRRGHRLAQAAV